MARDVSVTHIVLLMNSNSAKLLVLMMMAILYNLIIYVMILKYAN